MNVRKQERFHHIYSYTFLLAQAQDLQCGGYDYSTPKTNNSQTKNFIINDR